MHMMFAYTSNDGWQPGIGDPSLMGWVTVAAYFVGAYLCWRAALRISATSGRFAGPSMFWTAFAFGLALLGVNKQLDLQTWLTFFFRHLAVRDGWYRERRLLQAIFIVAVSLAGAAGLTGLRLLAGRLTKPTAMALAGGTFLGAFVLIRASSFHHVDRMLGVDLAGLRLNWILELGGIVCIALAAWRSSAGTAAAKG